MSLSGTVEWNPPAKARDTGTWSLKIPHATKLSLTTITTEPSCYRACVLQLLKSVYLGPVLRNKRSHHNVKPVHCNEKWPPPTATRESWCKATNTQCSQKQNSKKRRE